MVTLTRAQREVLALLGQAGPDGYLPTTTHTGQGYVSGTCAAALKRRGLARDVCVGPPLSAQFVGVAITAAGLAALDPS